MKIGIITFWDSQDNYGQIMQSFALQHYLESQGHEAFVIRYVPFQKQTFVHKLAKLSPVHIYAYYKLRKQKINTLAQKGIKRDFDLFRRNHIKYSERIYYGFEQLWCEDWSEYDAFVCGSDQIWSPKPEEQIKSYFLQFAPFKCKRIAYAPSFGREILPAHYQSDLKSLLAHFDAVSVREQSGVSICENVGIEAALVCDPTLLNTQGTYKELTSVTERENCAFCYLIKWDTLFPEQEIKDYIQSQDYKVLYFCTLGQKQYFEYEKDQTVENWLASIQKSKIAFTNSFHGTVFCILSHTPFITLPLTGEASAMNGRIYSLLRQLGLSDRIYTEQTTIKDIATNSIDWNRVDSLLAKFRNSSIEFLQSALASKTYNQKHNICFLTYGSVHHNYGGLDRVTELLADYFEKNGCNVYYVSQVKRDVYDHNRQLFMPNSHSWRNQENVEWFNLFLKDREIDTIINQEGNVNLTIPVHKLCHKITVLHFNPNYIDDNHFAYKFKNIPSPIKTIITIFRATGGDYLGLKYLRNKLRKNYKHQLDWSDEFVMLSDFYRPTLNGLIPEGYDEKKVIAINNPLIIEERCSEVPSKEKTILYVGRLDNSFKNVDRLIDVWAKIAERHTEWNFVICGGGPDELYLKEYTKQHAVPRVTFEGICDPTEQYKKAALIVMASSSSEGWGMVLVEAQRYGCVPVVVNSYAAVRDLIKNGQNGWFVDNTNDKYDQLVKQLEYVIENEDVRRAAQYASIMSVQQYDINNIGQLWLKLINR